MIDPLVSLSFAMQSNKGVYALLIGSGVSKAAGIPTGWDIVQDLIAKVAKASGEDPGSAPEVWYRHKFGKDANYSELLETLCLTPTERRNVLAGYFEPDEVERGQGLKSPTKAHRAIAKLVAQGFVRIILTTNFDRLLERAIQDEGIAPVVLSNADAVEGAMPIAHQKACIIKLHGDYHDTRIKNTASELDRYDARVDRLLNEVLDSFGLVVCGWSAQWDTALKAAIERAPARRFTMYFACKGQPTQDVSDLINRRAGVSLSISDADTFFERLQMQIEGLEQTQPHNSISIDALTALTKRMLADPMQSIALSDLLHEESEAARHSLQQVNQSKILQGGHATELELARARVAVERIAAILVAVVAWGHEDLMKQLVRTIDRTVLPTPQNGTMPLACQRLYPAMVLIYACGLTAVAHDKLGRLRTVLEQPSFIEQGRKSIILTNRFWGELHEVIKSIDRHKKDATPRSEHLFSVMRDSVRRHLPDDALYEDAFDQLEYLLALAYLDHDNESAISGQPWAPTGRYAQKAHRRMGPVSREEIALMALGANWPPLRAHFFNGSPTRATTLQQKLIEFIKRLPYS